MSLSLKFELTEQVTLSPARIAELEHELARLAKGLALEGVLITGVSLTRAEEVPHPKTPLSYVIRFFSGDIPRAPEKLKDAGIIVAERYEQGLGSAVALAQKLLPLNPSVGSVVIFSPCDEVVHSTRAERGGFEVEVQSPDGNVLMYKSWIDSKVAARTLAVNWAMDLSAELGDAWAKVLILDYSNRELGPKVIDTIER